MTPCDRLRRALAAGDQTLLADPSLRAHLAVCPTCAPALAADQALRRALAALSRPPLSPALERRLRAVAEGASSRAEPSAGRQAAPPATGDASPDSGAPRHATRLAARGSGRRDRAVAVLLLAACLAGLAFALSRLRPTPADFDATPPAPPTTLTRLPGESSPTPAAPTPWPTPRPPLPPLPRIPDEGLALPEGALVVVADEAGLLLFEGAETGRRLVENGWEEDLRVVGAKISPDGQWVSFAAQRPLATEGGGVWVIGSAGGAPRRVIDAPTLAERVPAQRTPATNWRTTLRSVHWTHDSKALLFDTYEADLEYGMDSAGNDDLWIQPVDGGEAQRLLPAGQGGDFSFSPDGRNIALVRRVTDGGSGYDSIALAPAKGGTSKELLRLAPIGTDSSWRPRPRPLWSPDSRSLFLILTKASPGRDGYADMEAPAPLIQLMLDGSYREVAPASRINVMNGFNMPLSPDGKTVALYHPLDPAVVPKAVAQSQQSSQETSAYPSDDLTPYPAPVVEPVQPDQEALMLATVGERAAVAYDLVMKGITHQLCWSPSGQRFAYDVVYPKWRIGTRNEAPREIDLAVAACHWLSDNLLLVREAKGLRILGMDGRERLLWASEDKESFTFDVHAQLAVRPTAQAEQTVEPTATKATHIPLPDGAPATTVLGANPRGTLALVASAGRYWLPDRAEGPPHGRDGRGRWQLDLRAHRLGAGAQQPRQ